MKGKKVLKVVIESKKIYRIPAITPYLDIFVNEEIIKFHSYTMLTNYKFSAINTHQDMGDEQILPDGVVDALLNPEKLANWRLDRRLLTALGIAGATWPLWACANGLSTLAEGTPEVLHRQMDPYLQLYKDVRDNEIGHVGGPDVNTTLTFGAAYTNPHKVLTDYRNLSDHGGFDMWQIAKMAADASINQVTTDNILSMYRTAVDHKGVPNTAVAIDIATISATFGKSVDEVLAAFDDLKAYKGDAVDKHFIDTKPAMILTLTLLNGGNYKEVLQTIKQIRDIGGLDEGSMVMISLAALITKDPKSTKKLYDAIYGSNTTGMTGYNAIKLVIGTVITGYSAPELVEMYNYAYSNRYQASSNEIALLTLLAAVKQSRASLSEEHKKAALLFCDLLLT